MAIQITLNRKYLKKAKEIKEIITELVLRLATIKRNFF